MSKLFILAMMLISFLCFPYKMEGNAFLFGVYLNKMLFHDIVKYTRYSVLFKYTTTTYSSAFNIVSYLQATFSRFKRQISDKF